jgi:hypothetical protein
MDDYASIGNRGDEIQMFDLWGLLFCNGAMLGRQELSRKGFELIASHLGTNFENPLKEQDDWGLGDHYPCSIAMFQRHI